MKTDFHGVTRKSGRSEVEERRTERELRSNPARKEIRVADSFKGKEIHAGGTWEVPKGWKILFQTEAILFLIAMFAVIIGDIANFGRNFMIPAIISAVIVALIAAITMTVCIMKMNKKDPMDVRYYDVDYKENHLTGEVHDNTREVSKDEFFGNR